MSCKLYLPIHKSEAADLLVDVVGAEPEEVKMRIITLKDVMQGLNDGRNCTLVT